VLAKRESRRVSIATHRVLGFFIIFLSTSPILNIAICICLTSLSLYNASLCFCLSVTNPVWRCVFGAANPRPLSPLFLVLSVFAYRKKSILSPQLSLKFSFSLELQNRVNHLPQLLKLFILPPWPGYSWFQRRFYLFLFYLFRLIFWKIIVNHRKIIK
jgi:hypothetical protein